MKKINKKSLLMLSILAFLLFSAPGYTYAGLGIVKVEILDVTATPNLSFAPRDVVRFRITLTEEVSDMEVEVQQRYSTGQQPIGDASEAIGLRDRVALKQKDTISSRAEWQVVTHVSPHAPNGIVLVKVKVKGAGFVRTGYVVE